MVDEIFYSVSARQEADPSEIAYLKSLLGAYIWVDEVIGVPEDGALTSLLRFARGKAPRPQAGSTLKTFCVYMKSNETGAERWQSSQSGWQIGRGHDEGGRDWVISPQSELPGHWASPVDSNWVFLAK